MSGKKKESRSQEEARKEAVSRGRNAILANVDRKLLLTDPDTALADTLADLMFWSKEKEVDWEDAMQRAESYQDLYDLYEEVD